MKSGTLTVAAVRWGGGGRRRRRLWSRGPCSSSSWASPSSPLPSTPAPSSAPPRPRRSYCPPRGPDRPIPSVPKVPIVISPRAFAAFAIRRHGISQSTSPGLLRRSGLWFPSLLWLKFVCRIPVYGCRFRVDAPALLVKGALVRRLVLVDCSLCLV